MGKIHFPSSRGPGPWRKAHRLRKNKKVSVTPINQQTVEGDQTERNYNRKHNTLLIKRIFELNIEVRIQFGWEIFQTENIIEAQGTTGKPSGFLSHLLVL